MTLIIAEIGQNHEGNFEILKELTESAIRGGADIVKYQYWNVDKVYHKEDVRYKPAKSRELDFKTLYDYIKEIKKRIPVMISFFGCYESIINKMRKQGFLIKWASSEYEYDKIKLNDYYSTGYNKDLNEKGIAMSCVPQYPANYDLCVEAIIYMQKKNNNYYTCMGYSDHYEGLDMAKLAIDKGAFCIEKHYTNEWLRGNSSFRDHKCSMTENELIELADYAGGFVRKDKDGFRRFKVK